MRIRTAFIVQKSIKYRVARSKRRVFASLHFLENNGPSFGSVHCDQLITTHNVLKSFCQNPADHRLHISICAR